jgi:2-isopropylmalate synthase
MREVFGYHVKSISDRAHKELSPDEVHDIFLKDFVNVNDVLRVGNAIYEDFGVAEVRGTVDVDYRGQIRTVEMKGNGRLDCISNALKVATGMNYTLESYVQHALEEKSTAKAASYVSISYDGATHWGVGIHSDIMISSVYALVAAVNRMLKAK